MSKINQKIINNPKGFTIAELIIVAPVVILLIGVFISTIIAMTGTVLSGLGEANLSYDVKYAVDMITKDIENSGGYLATNNITVLSPQGLNDDATNFTNIDTANGSTLILNTYGITYNPLNPARNIIYTSGPNLCWDYDVNQNKPLIVNVIYFVKKNPDNTKTLWRRSIAPQNYETLGCNGGSLWQKPSCTPGIVNSNCKTEDIKLIEKLSDDGFNVQYILDSDHKTINYLANSPTATNEDRQAALANSKEVKISLGAINKVSGKDIAYNTSIKITSPNNDLNNSNSEPIELLIVGGGGGGGCYLSGGGGGGGVIYKNVHNVTPKTYPIVVGNGGTCANGENSSFDGLVAIGGGQGGTSTTWNTGGVNGGNGGSGGGASAEFTSIRYGGIGTIGQGQNGGNSKTYVSATKSYIGGGGGGYTNIGESASTYKAGDGGSGFACDISGTIKYYGAGGGGGVYRETGGTGTAMSGIGGSGVGGGGGVFGAVTYPGTGGLVNSGSGGGGGHVSGYPGGSGVVIISYPTGTITATGGTITTANGKTIHTFFSSGNFIVS